MTDAIDLEHLGSQLERVLANGSPRNLRRRSGRRLVPGRALGAGDRCVGQANPGTPPPRCGKGRAGGASRTMRTLRPSTQPRCANSWMKASSQGWDIGPPSVHPSRAPIRRIRSGCTLASTGHAAALPSPALNSRRRIVIPPADRGGAYRGAGCKGTGRRPRGRRPRPRLAPGFPP